MQRVFLRSTLVSYAILHIFGAQVFSITAAEYYRCNPRVLRHSNKPFDAYHPSYYPHIGARAAELATSDEEPIPSIRLRLDVAAFYCQRSALSLFAEAWACTTTADLSPHTTSLSNHLVSKDVWEQRRALQGPATSAAKPRWGYCSAYNDAIIACKAKGRDACAVSDVHRT